MIKVPFANPKRSFTYKSKGHKIEEQIIAASSQKNVEIEKAKALDKDEAEKILDKVLDQYPERVTREMDK